MTATSSSIVQTAERWLPPLSSDARSAQERRGLRSIVVVTLAVAVLALGSVFQLAPQAEATSCASTVWAPEYRPARPGSCEISLPGWMLLVHNNEDKIYVRPVRNLPTTQIQVVLTVAPKISWWKGAEIVDGAGWIRAGAYTQDANRGPNYSLTWLNFDLASARLILSKAKLFGIHTAMYRFTIGQLSGHTIYLYWAKDEPCPAVITNLDDC